LVPRLHFERGMKHFKTVVKSLPPIALIVSLMMLGSCASSSKNGQEIAVSGPTVLDAKTTPGTFQLNQNLEPVSRTQVMASVKDFQNKVTDVRVRFLHVPLEMPMKQVSPSTWVAELAPNQLKQLAVNGHTMRYEANIIARDNAGQTAVSKQPIEIAVSAPDINATG
jgi:hypothetical protein